MPKASSSFVCQQCGYRSPQFLGRCPECGSWNSLVEEQVVRDSGQARMTKRGKLSEIIKISDIKNDSFDRLNSGIDEFDRVLGGGIVLGSVVLVSGDPGIGKSTLLSQLAININSEHSENSESQRVRKSVSQKSDSSGISDISDTPSHFEFSGNVLYVAGEESARQIKLRIERITKNADLSILNETDVDAVVASIEQYKPKLVIVDSIQTMETQDLTSAASSVGQVRESAHRLQRLAKSLHIPIFLVGHVTKEGNIAGPKTLEHLVDVVLSLEGDLTNQFRVLRANKNRFGSTDEVGIFEMVEEGIIEVKNPSQIFLEQRMNAPGSAVVPVMTGLRPLLVEIQALVTKSNLPIPRRMSTGIDNNRLQLLAAVLIKRLHLPLFDSDIFINVVGGLKITEPAADLGICMAILSSLKDKSIPLKTAFIGEVGLLGEVRRVRDLDKRSKEAKKLGFTNIITPDKAKSLSQALSLGLAS